MNFRLSLAILTACVASTASAAPDLTLRQAQEAMRNLGIYTGAIDGKRSEATRFALQQVQSLCATPSTGALNTQTIHCLVNKELFFPDGMSQERQHMTCRVRGYSTVDNLLCGPNILFLPPLPVEGEAASIYEAQRHFGAIGLYVGERQIRGMEPNADSVIALKQFQQENNLPITGELDTATGLLITQQMHAMRAAMLSRSAIK